MLEALQNGDPAPSGDNPMFWQFGNQYAVRDGNWKLVRSNDSPGRTPSSRFLDGHASDGNLQLFNLKDDLSEQKNLYDECPDMAQKLGELYLDWRKDIETGE